MLSGLQAGEYDQEMSQLSDRRHGSRHHGKETQNTVNYNTIKVKQQEGHQKPNIKKIKK